MTERSNQEGSQRIRLFFGMPLPPALLAPALETQAAWRRRANRSGPELRFIAEQNLHLTLKFMGWMALADVDGLVTRLREVAAAFAPIETKALALGAFPTPKHARVLVVELDSTTSELAELAQRLEAVAHEAGVPDEKRPFRAHLTLARLSNPADVRELLAARPWTPIRCTLDGVRLYQSTLLPSGSVYSVLGEAHLGQR